MALFSKVFVSIAFKIPLTLKSVIKYIFVAGLLTTSLVTTAKEPTIMVFGDSISAAYGMEKEQGWVHLLANQLQKDNQSYQVINASISGETTGGGLVRLPKSLDIYQPDIVILELGGNDGLRGYPISKIEANLNAMMRMAQSSGARVLLIGMVLPPNYGKRYTSAFASIYEKIAQEYDSPLLPFLLQGVATDDSLMQRDGIHPKPEAQKMMLDDIWPYLEKLLH